MASINEGVSSNASFMDHFSCKICLEILDKPLQCQNNEHYFCTLCIRKHLTKSQTCPLCKDELTLRTLRPPSRMVVDVLSQLKKPRCNYVNRGCKEYVKVEDLVVHHESCGFAPVLCPKESCGETINRQDLPSHNNELCKFRKVMCDQCREEMTFSDFELHPCHMKSEIDELKSCMTDVKASLIEISQYIKKIQDPLRNMNKSSLIFVASERSFEIFDWSTKKWTLYKDVLFFNHYKSFSFTYKDLVMVCGGNGSNKIEYVNIRKDPQTAIVFPAALRKVGYIGCPGKGAVCGHQLFTFYDAWVCKLDLDSSSSAEQVLKLDEYWHDYGVECVNKNIIIFGGKYTDKQARGRTCTTTKDIVREYDVINNTTKNLAPLPYPVSCMATVCYQDNIIILGGQNSDEFSLRSVVMYNVTTQESKRLPSMLEGRSGCAAVIIDNVIVVMGGCDSDTANMVFRSNPSVALKTVEYHVLGQKCWNKLPDMHLTKRDATASVQM